MRNEQLEVELIRLRILVFDAIKWIKNDRELSRSTLPPTANTATDAVSNQPPPPKLGQVSLAKNEGADPLYQPRLWYQAGINLVRRWLRAG